MRPEPIAEPLAQPPRVGGPELRESFDPVRTKPLDGLGADPGDQPRRGAAEPLARLLARQDHESVRLLGVGGHLGDELAGPDSDRAPEPGALRHRDLDSPGGGARALQRRQVEVGLVEPDDLHEVDVLA